MRVLGLIASASAFAGCLLTAPAREQFEGGDAQAGAPSTDGGSSQDGSAASSSVVYDGPGEVTAIAAAGGSVYFGLRLGATGKLLSWRSGTAAKTIAEVVPTSMDLDPEYLFWTTSAPTGTVWRTPRFQDVPPISSAQAAPTSVTLGGQRVHWISQRSVVASDADLSTRLTTLASDQPSPSLLAFANGTLFWVNRESGDLVARDFTGSSSTRVILRAQQATTSMAVWDGVLFRTVGAEVRRVNVDGTDEGSFAFEATGAVAVDASGVYWTTATGVRRRRLTPSAPEELLVDGRAGCALIALESTGTAFACNAEGRAVVLRAPK